MYYELPYLMIKKQLFHYEGDIKNQKYFIGKDKHRLVIFNTWMFEQRFINMSMILIISI